MWGFTIFFLSMNYMWTRCHGMKPANPQTMSCCSLSVSCFCRASQNKRDFTDFLSLFITLKGWLLLRLCLCQLFQLLRKPTYSDSPEVPHKASGFQPLKHGEWQLSVFTINRLNRRIHVSCNETDRWTQTKEKYVDNLEMGQAEGRRNKKHIGGLIDFLFN